MKQLILPALVVLLAACSSDKDEQFCDCLSVSEELNEEAAKYGSIALDKITDEDVANLKQLTAKKDSICAPYELLGGEELKKKREACK
ncbi:hypothetical protein H9Y05_13500 [Crocinitomicaceae bacterium CZZ-1]|uniref:Lipoprotein n=1 Tax=Taishania pollutisoli TaxID=2766479 RepID=A0A8J6P819_9FLAO|nr:hypothetical protein [Taishania pollutisoli]MBC9813487.1 hypothetical protein [Taishania pollutisoli]MBX2948993.1 hypothetical protein [Crocinitomicaceae bacterium]NGF76077.1 hypothetical protein [Fluviicola sp. SGL-29]